MFSGTDRILALLGIVPTVLTGLIALIDLIALTGPARAEGDILILFCHHLRLHRHLHLHHRPLKNGSLIRDTLRPEFHRNRMGRMHQEY
jgi:hypothetical protein